MSVRIQLTSVRAQPVSFSIRWILQNSTDRNVGCRLFSLRQAIPPPVPPPWSRTPLYQGLAAWPAPPPGGCL